MIIHRERKSNDNYEDILRIFKIKNYGRSKILFGNFVKIFLVNIFTSSTAG